MTQFSAFGVNGNGTSGPGSSISFGGAFVSGLTFKVTSSGQFLYGYYYWRSDSGQSASAQGALWTLTGNAAGTFQAGTSASTSSMTVGAWNYIPLAAPFALTSGTVYRAVIGVTGNFNDTHTQFGTGGPYVGGIVNGPLTVYSAPVGQGGTNQAPFTNVFQGTFGTSGSDPTTNLPSSDDSQANFFLDVLVGPAAATGSPAPFQPSATVSRRAARRGQWRGTVTSTANAHGPSGTVQPRAAVPVPRRSAARAVWRAVAGPGNATGPRGSVQPRATVSVPRRAAARAVRNFILGQANAHGPAGTVQPRATVQPPRRQPSRAVWRGPATAGPAAPVTRPAGAQPHGFISSRRLVGAVWGGAYTPPSNASGPAGTAPAHLVVARRTAARGTWAGTITRTVNAAPPGASPAPRPRLITARRVPARAVAHGSPAPFPPPSGTVQPAATAPARRHAPARVIWHGGPVPGQQPKPATGGLVRRRAGARGLWHGGAGAPPPATAPGIPASGKSVTTRRPPSRGQWHGSPTRTSNALPVAVPAPRQRLIIARRTAYRAWWRGITPATSNASALIRVSAPNARQQWAATAARQQWSAPGARQQWSAPDARNSS